MCVCVKSLVLSAYAQQPSAHQLWVLENIRLTEWSIDRARKILIAYWMMAKTDQSVDYID